jgi:hypothetical protein
LFFVFFVPVSFYFSLLLLLFHLNYWNVLSPGGLLLFDNTEITLAVFNELYLQLLSCENFTFFFIFRLDQKTLVRCVL